MRTPWYISEIEEGEGGSRVDLRAADEVLHPNGLAESVHALAERTVLHHRDACGPEVPRVACGPLQQERGRRTQHRGGADGQGPRDASISCRKPAAEQPIGTRMSISAVVTLPGWSISSCAVVPMRPRAPA